MENLAVLFILPILTSIISYLGARHQANTDLQKLKEEQNSEIKKIKEQSLFEIEKIKAEMENQAKLYEKNAQTDMITGFFGKVLEGDTSVIDNMEKITKMAQGGANKNQKHPTKRR